MPHPAQGLLWPLGPLAAGGLWRGPDLPPEAEPWELQQHREVQPQHTLRVPEPINLRDKNESEMRKARAHGRQKVWVVFVSL